MLTVWGRTTSLNVRKVLWALAETGIAYRRIEAGLHFGVNDTPEYLAMNPNGLVPVIDDDGFTLWESNVIVRYLASKHAMGTLCPSDPKDRYSAERWMDWQQSVVNVSLGPLFMQLVRTPPEKQDAAAIARFVAATEKATTILEAHLSNRDYVNGAAFTMGDIPIGTAMCRWFMLPIERPARPNIAAWQDRLRERQGFRDFVDQPLT